MVHYIRFLRTPSVSEISKREITVSAVLTITTDLGDAFFPIQHELIARFVDAVGSGEILCVQNVSWKPGSRALKLNLLCPAKHASRSVKLHITTLEAIAALVKGDVPAVVDVWSMTFSLKARQRTDAFVERRLLLPGKCQIRSIEETGDSIARHIWDASLGFLIQFRRCLTATEPATLPCITKLLTEEKATRLKVLEVGAGCGVVGIAFAQFRKSDMILTDLDDAQAILQSNVDCASPIAGSSIRHQVLSWGSSLENLSGSKFDLVLVSDCIYNPDSSVLLVETLKQISDQNAHILILVGFKRRHDADDIFFERMQTANFKVEESCEILLPHTMTDYDADEPKVEMFVYRRDESNTTET